MSSAALVLGAVVLAMSFLAASNPIRAIKVAEKVKIDETVIVATIEAKPKIEYYLPYPGILPDSPLYKIKAARDRILLILTLNEEKKARRELLFADKRINAAVFLTEGGKSELGVTTAVKAEKYLEQAVGRAEKMHKGGQDVKSLMLELQKSVAKHTEILETLQLKLAGEERKTIELAMATTKILAERLGQIFLEAN